MPSRIELTGKRFGKLEVVEYLGSIEKKSKYRCICDCGNESIVAMQNLVMGRTKSCGCILAKNRNDGMHKTHGMSKTRLYHIWENMKYRCSNPSSTSWERYGGRGIKICDDWSNSFISFMDSVGEPPTNRHSIDRINNDGDYEPGNVKWSTPSEQSKNKRKYRRRIGTV